MRGGRLREVLIIGPLDWENFGVLDNWPLMVGGRLRWSHMEVSLYLKAFLNTYYILSCFRFFLMYECVRVLI